MGPMRGHRRAALRLGPLGGALLAALVLLARPARAEELAERQGARVGVSLLFGVGELSGSSGVSTTAPLVGASFRFGGAFTDRVHLYGEFTLATLPNARFGGTSEPAFLGALDLCVQVYVLPRLYVRAGIGAVDHATLGSTDYWSYPGPHIVGGVGYDLQRRGERAFSLELSVADEFFSTGGSSPYGGGYTVNLGAAFDWF